MPDDIPSQNDPVDDQKPDDQQTPTETPEEKAARLEAELVESKKHSRKWETLAKANKDAAKELEDLRAKDATPDQRLAAAEERAAQAEARLTRTTVALETGLPANLASLLTGDEEAMREQAKALIEFRGTATPPPKTPVVPDPSQGPRDRDAKPSAADEGRAAARARAERRSGKKS